MRLSAQKKRRFFQLKRSAKVFIPTPGYQIVVPFRKISVVLIFLLSLLCVYLAFRSDLFLVHSIEARNNSRPKTTLDVFNYEKKKALDLIEQKVKGRSFFFVNQKALRKEVLKDFLSISEISFEKSFPNRLLVETVPREPVAAVRFVKEASPSAKLASESGRIATDSASLELYFLVDQGGLIFAKTASCSSLPLFYLFDEKIPSLGEDIGQRRIQVASEITGRLKEDGVKISKVFLTAFGSIEMFLTDGPKVLFSSQKEAVVQVTSLQLILNSTKMEGKTPETIDLRFEKPVVRFKS